MPEKSKELTTSQQTGVTALAAPWDPENIEIWSTLPPEDTIRIKTMAGRLEDNGDKTIEVSDVICHRAQIVDDDGVINDRTRTILVTPKGEAFATVAEGVKESLRELVYLRGTPPPWRPPIKVKLAIVRTRKGFRTFKLIPA